MKSEELTPVLLVSATEAECVPIMQKLSGSKTLLPYLYSGTLHGLPVELLISGIGSVATIFRLSQTVLQRSYSRAISIGIAGSFVNHVNIGETVQIVEDCFADLGIDDNGRFYNLREAGLPCDDFDCDLIINPCPTASSHPKLRGITVQTSSGSEKRITKLILRYFPEVETMENAAFFYVCRKTNIPFASYRAISNFVEPRNRKNWQTEKAIKNVNDSVIQLFSDSIIQ